MFYLPFFDPDTISSIRRIMHALSMAVLMVCTLTLNGSQIPSSSMLTKTPVVPLIPKSDAGGTPTPLSFEFF